MPNKPWQQMHNRRRTAEGRRCSLYTYTICTLSTVERFEPNIIPFSTFPGLKVCQVGQRKNQRPIPQSIINLTADIVQTGVVIKGHGMLSATGLVEITPLGFTLLDVLIRITLHFYKKQFALLSDQRR